MNYIKGKVWELIKDCDVLKAIDIAEAKKIVGDLGYTIVYYQIGNAADEALLEKIGKLEYAKTRSGFSYKDDTQKLVFVRKYQTAGEELIVLTHEIGHICLGHLDITGFCHDSDVQKEEEALRFSLYLRSYQGMVYKRRWRRPSVISTICFISALVGIIAIAADANDNKTK